MFKIKVDRILEKDIDQVFEILVDHSNYKLFSDISDSELLKEGKNEKNGNGALRKIVAGPFKLIERIIEINRPYAIKYHIEDTSPMPMNHKKGEITLEKIGYRTRVIWVSEGRIALPVIGVAFDKAIEFKVSATFNNMLNEIETRV